jgi:hypothetical protein
MRGKTDGPEKEWRFVRIDLPIGMHENPIPSLHHLLCNLGVTRFIRIPEIPLPQVKKIEEETESQEDRNLHPFLRIDS